MLQKSETNSLKLRVMERIGYIPTEGQLPIHESSARLRLVAGGERGGKSRSGSADVLGDGLVTALDQAGGVLLWYVGNEYGDCREEFRYSLNDLSGLGLVEKYSFPSFGPCSLLARWAGGFIEIETKVPKGLVARAPHIILGCEAPRMSYEAYLACIGRLSQRNGKLLLTGTFLEDYGWYVDLWTAWQLGNGVEKSFSLPTWSNTYEYPGGRDDPKVKDLEVHYSDVPGLFDSKCGGVPTPPVGLVFREFSHLVHVRDTPYVPDSPVYLCVDPSRGTNPYAVVVCQTRMGDEIHVIDEIYERGKICEEIIEIAKARPWWSDTQGGFKDRPRKKRLPQPGWTGGHGGAIGHDAPDDLKRWGRLGGVWLTSKNIKEEHLIRRVQTFLAVKGRGDEHDDNRTRFQVAPHCKNTIKEFTKWRRADNNKPIDEDNHALKALGYWLINKFGFVAAAEKPKRVSTARPKLVAIRERAW